ncbi:MAG TPA: hypothetical protein VHR18_09245 [Solirubrobacterales bacterium]|jgi:hypothetical protein|nr:hypothetical protein [Solirubrobacterales bacterium]
MNELIEKIKSKGYWDISILPEPFKADRYHYETLEGVLARATVRLRGWPVPYIDYNAGFKRGEDWIGQEIDGQVTSHYEAWRFFMSGQFNQLRAVSADWREGQEATPTPPEFDFASVIEVWEILYYVTEVFELAARFTMGGPPAEKMKIVVRLHGLKDRGLVVGQNNRSPFAFPYKATLPDYCVERVLSNDALLGGASEAAVQMSRDFFLRFGWQPSTEQLVEMQEELTKDRW